MDTKRQARGHRRAASCYNFHFEELGVVRDSPGDENRQKPLSQKSFCPSSNICDKNTTIPSRDKDSSSSSFGKTDLPDFDFFDYFSKNNHPSLRDSVGETSVIVEELDQCDVDRMKKGLGLKYGAAGGRVLRERRDFENDENRPQNQQQSEQVGRQMQICESPKSDAKRESSNRIMKIQVKYISELGRIEEDAHEMSLANSRNSLTLKNSAQKTLARIVRCSGSGIKLLQEQSNPENLILEEFSVDDGANKENKSPALNINSPKDSKIALIMQKRNEPSNEGKTIEQSEMTHIKHETQKQVEKQVFSTQDPMNCISGVDRPGKPEHKRSESISVLKSKLQDLYNQHRVHSISTLSQATVATKSHARQNSVAATKPSSISPPPGTKNPRQIRPQSGTSANSGKSNPAGHSRQGSQYRTSIFTESRPSLPTHQQQGSTSAASHRRQPSQSSTPRGPHQPQSSNTAATNRPTQVRLGETRTGQQGFLAQQALLTPSPRPLSGVLKPAAKHDLLAGAFAKQTNVPSVVVAAADRDTSAKRTQALLQKCHSSDGHSVIPVAFSPTETSGRTPIRQGSPRHSLAVMSDLCVTAPAAIDLSTGLPKSLDNLANLANLQRECLAALLTRLTALEEESLQLSTGCTNLQLQNTSLQTEIRSLQYSSSKYQGLNLGGTQQRSSYVH